MTRTLPILLVSLLLGCSEDEDPEILPAATSDATDASDAADETTGSAAANPFDCEGEDFQPSPFGGPGIDPETGAIVGAPADSYVLHTTQAVMDPDSANDFIAITGPVIDQMMRADGLIGFSLASDSNCGFARTLGVWESEGKMYDFVYSGAHAEAIAVARDVTATGRFTHFDIDPSEVDQAWDLAFAALEDVEPPPLYD